MTAAQQISQPAVDAAMSETVGPHLRAGETLRGVFEANLDPLLPLHFDWKYTRQRLLWLPVRFLWDLFVRVLEILLMFLVPRFLAEIVEVFLPPYRPYGLSPLTRLYRNVRRPFHGGSWDGGKGSIAWQLWQAVRILPWRHHCLAFDHDELLLALTDQRMLALSCDGELLFELPAGTYGWRRETPDYWFGHRVDLTFADGSWIALGMPSNNTKDQLSALLG